MNSNLLVLKLAVFGDFNALTALGKVLSLLFSVPHLDLALSLSLKPSVPDYGSVVISCLQQKATNNVMIECS